MDIQKSEIKAYSEKLSGDLKALSELMFEIGVEMDYFGGLSEIGEHGRELIGASKMVEMWAIGVVNESESQGKV